MVGVHVLVVFAVLANGAQGSIFSKKTRIISEDEAKEIMLSGTGGITVVDVGLDDVLVVQKEKLYTCRDLEIKGSTVKCPSGYDKFEFRTPRDQCYNLRYSVAEERNTKTYCLSPNYKPSELLVENNQLICKSDTKSLNATLISEENFYHLCRRRITDPIKVLFFAKNRDNLPIANNVECSYYTCIFATYRKVDRRFGGREGTFETAPIIGNTRPSFGENAVYQKPNMGNLNHNIGYNQGRVGTTRGSGYYPQGNYPSLYGGRPNIQTSYIADSATSEYARAVLPESRTPYTPYDPKMIYADDTQTSYAPDVKVTYTDDAKVTSSPDTKTVHDDNTSHVPDTKLTSAEDTTISHAPNAKSPHSDDSHEIATDEQKNTNTTMDSSNDTGDTKPSQ